MPPWRDAQLCLRAVEGWITGSIDQHGEQTMVFVAEDDNGERLGFATVTRDTHFTGVGQAYIGELATSEAAEGCGVGKALLQACEQWARDQGYAIIALATGARNTRALGFYHQHGFQDEDIKLVKFL
jgi:GNAT superfamily N-acetyltransferase